MIALDGNVLVETGYQGSNNAIVRTPEGLVLIDAPMRPSDALQWRDIVLAQGRASWVVYTDHHPDHVLGAAFLPGDIVAHEDTRRHLTEAPQLSSAMRRVLDALDADGMSQLPETFTLRAPSLTFTDRLSLFPSDVRIDLIHMPGHTANSIVAALPDQGIAFAGDTMCEAGFPAFIEADIGAWIASLQLFETMAIDRIVPGHGEICGMAEARAFRQRMQDLAGEVSRRIDRGDSREAVVADVSYPDRIHTAVNGWPSYPEDFVRAIMRASIGRIYDSLRDGRTFRHP